MTNDNLLVEIQPQVIFQPIAALNKVRYEYKAKSARVLVLSKLNKCSVELKLYTMMLDCEAEVPVTCD